MYGRLDGRGFPGQLGLHHDGVIDGLRELVDAAHANGALIGPQLYHAGRQTSSASTGTTPVAPSPIPDPLMGEVPVELTIDDIADLVRCFGDAARRSEAAGCDFVQIHGAHGYLVTQFLSPFTNRRTDETEGTPPGGDGSCSRSSRRSAPRPATASRSSSACRVTSSFPAG